MSLPLQEEVKPGQCRRASGHLVSCSPAPVLRCNTDMAMITQAEHPRSGLGSLKAELSHMAILSGNWQKKPLLDVGTEVLTPTGQWAESEGIHWSWVGMHDWHLVGRRKPGMLLMSCNA